MVRERLAAGGPDMSKRSFTHKLLLQAPDGIRRLYLVTVTFDREETAREMGRKAVRSTRKRSTALSKAVTASVVEVAI